MRIVLSSAHGAIVRGAVGVLDEVNESRRVVEQVAKDLRGAGHNVIIFHDDRSADKNANLRTIVNFHNAQQRDLDVSIHFNAFRKTDRPMGTECLYVTQLALAQRVAMHTTKAGGFINRGAKKRPDLYFLNMTHRPAILDEVCFVDSDADAALYRQHFFGICTAIAGAISGHPPMPVTEVLRQVEPNEPEDIPDETAGPLWHENIVCTIFGGRRDPNKSAYPPYDKITDQEVSCALPYRFVGPRPFVEIVNRKNGKRVICQIRDIGPWNVADDYWNKGARPQAETGKDEKNRKTNLAGIDITPAAARAISLVGKGMVDWAFVQSPDQETPTA